MGLRNVLLVSRRGVSVAGNAYELDGVGYSHVGSYNIWDWIGFIVGDDGGSGSSISIINEFSHFMLSKKLKILNEDLANMLGLPFNISSTTSDFYAQKWGDAKLILQNAQKDLGKINSVLTKFNEINWDFNNNTEILRGFAPENSYDSKNDRSVYKASISYFPGSKKTYVKEFFQQNGAGTSSNVNIFGIEYKIPSTVSLNLILSIYKGFKDRYSSKELKEWEIGLIEAI